MKAILSKVRKIQPSKAHGIKVFRRFKLYENKRKLFSNSAYMRTIFMKKDEKNKRQPKRLHVYLVYPNILIFNRYFPDCFVFLISLFD